MKGLTGTKKDIMKVVWDNNKPLSLKEIHNELFNHGDKRIKLDTLEYYVCCLVAEGYLRDNDGESFDARITKERYVRMSLKSIISFWFDDDAEALVKILNSETGSDFDFDLQAAVREMSKE